MHGQSEENVQPTADDPSATSLRAQETAALQAMADAAELRELRAREEAWIAERRALEQSIAEMRASTSWRLTAPVRGLRAMANRGRAAVARIVRRPGRPEHVRPAIASALASTATTAAEAAADVVFDVIFVIGCWEGESKRYRVYNVAAALSERGFKVQVIGDADCPDILVKNWRARAAVFFRTPYRSEFKIAEVLEHLRARGARIVFDVDDLVFQPSLVTEIHGVSKLSAEDKELYLDGVLRYRRLLKLCDLVTVTTEPLARAVESLGAPARIVPNSVNREQIAASETIMAARRPSDRLTIGYFSGSRTHERDFAQAAPALLQLMRERDDFDLLVVGYLDLGEEWAPFRRRIRRRDFMPPLEMLSVLGECDINIAPLETGDRFCEAKSELKYFEAALVETPSVVSPTEPFRQAIEEGVTGFLAETPEAWKDALSRLLDDRELRQSIGRAARASALRAFGVETLADAAEAALFGDLPPARAPWGLGPPPIGPDRLRIDWIVPQLLIGGGGHRNIIRAAHYLQTFGHDVSLQFLSADGEVDELAYLVGRHFYPFEGEVRRYDGRFRRSDVILATHWTTVAPALEGRAHTGEVMYFVQDFEPLFYPMGSDHVLAENTYRQGLYCICSGPWCENLLKADYGLEADHFRFPVNREVYRPRPRTEKDLNLVFFAKPEMPRRCFEIGAMALAFLHRMRPDVKITLFGSRELRHQTLDFPAAVLEIVPTIQDLADLYANADLGLVFSTTNPSLVPYEMMASGCPVLDLDLPGAETNYDNRRDIAFLADPSPLAMAEQIAALLDRPAELADRRAKGVAFVAGFPTELEMAKRVEELIVGRVKRDAAPKARARS